MKIIQHISVVGRKKFSVKIGIGHILGIVNTHVGAKNQKKLMKSRENAKRKRFSGIFPENARKSFLNWAPSQFGHCHFASLCQNSEKNNEPILRKAGNRRTDGRTNLPPDKSKKYSMMPRLA